MQCMTEASETWRSLHKEAHRNRQGLRDGYRQRNGGVTEEWKDQRRTDLADAESRQTDALVTFRQACARVGQLRADLEAAGGPNWKSCASMPASAASSNARDGSVSGDPTRATCAQGHRMDLDNTHFYADGGRKCRTCMDAQAKRMAAKQAASRPASSRRARSTASTASTASIEAARALLADPAYADVSVRNIAAQVGLASTTAIYNRLPVAELRRTAGAAR
jgi:hypothetical protein